MDTHEQHHDASPLTVSPTTRSEVSFDETSPYPTIQVPSCLPLCQRTYTIKAGGSVRRFFTLSDQVSMHFSDLSEPLGWEKQTRDWNSHIDYESVVPRVKRRAFASEWIDNGEDEEEVEIHSAMYPPTAYPEDAYPPSGLVYWRSWLEGKTEEVVETQEVLEDADIQNRVVEELETVHTDIGNRDGFEIDTIPLDRADAGNSDIFWLELTSPLQKDNIIGKVSGLLTVLFDHTDENDNLSGLEMDSLIRADCANAANGHTSWLELTSPVKEDNIIGAVSGLETASLDNADDENDSVSGLDTTWLDRVNAENSKTFSPELISPVQKDATVEKVFRQEMTSPEYANHEIDNVSGLETKWDTEASDAAAILLGISMSGYATVVNTKQSVTGTPDLVSAHSDDSGSGTSPEQVTSELAVSTIKANMQPSSDRNGPYATKTTNPSPSFHTTIWHNENTRSGTKETLASKLEETVSYEYEQLQQSYYLQPDIDFEFSTKVKGKRKARLLNYNMSNSNTHIATPNPYQELSQPLQILQLDGTTTANEEADEELEEVAENQNIQRKAKRNKQKKKKKSKSKSKSQSTREAVQPIVAIKSEDAWKQGQFVPEHLFMNAALHVFTAANISTSISGPRVSQRAGGKL
ncbi:hypothetical protein VTL71DRAFT_6424 [Oculimacula yallundae]|uniref:Uncharacterized protein n=1 Tax=Oculimacula yallundae TaxID=86028 RepID=A0ABR4BWX7_9HELO